MKKSLRIWRTPYRVCSFKGANTTRVCWLLMADTSGAAAVDALGGFWVSQTIYRGERETRAGNEIEQAKQGNI